MKNLKGKIALVIFICSWIGLYFLTGSRTPWQDMATGDHITVHLGDVPSENYDRMGFTKAVVNYAPSEDAWLVGTERGELHLISSQGRRLWTRSLGIGKLITMSLNNEGTVAYVGENSQSGNLYAVDIKSGDVLWHFEAKDFVGSEPNARSHPSIVHTVVDKEDNVYANCYRFVISKEGRRGYMAKMLAISKEGKLLWQFPQQEAMDSWINWCDVNDANGRVVLSTSAYDYRQDMKYKDSMYFLSKDKGQLLNSVRVEPIVPFDNTVMRGSPNFSKDGKYLAAACSDGRGFLFDQEGRVVWQRAVARPTMIDGSYINASGRDGLATEAGVLFTTINTFNRENWQLPTPVAHPGNNSLFMFHYDGTFGYQYEAKGTMEELKLEGNLVAAAIGRNVRTHDYSAHGALVLESGTGKEVFFAQTEGPCQAVALNREGTMVAAVEAPAVVKSGKVLGIHQLHLWHIK